MDNIFLQLIAQQCCIAFARNTTSVAICSNMLCKVDKSLTLCNMAVIHVMYAQHLHNNAF